MIVTISEFRAFVSKAVSYKAEQWAEDASISEEMWHELYDIVEANFSRFDWITQLAKEKLMTKDLDTEMIHGNMFFMLLERDFGWAWDCPALNVKTYWPVGFSHGTERILGK